MGTISRKKLAAVAIAGVAIVPFAVSQDASASAPGGPALKVVKTLSSAYVGPLQFAVGRHKILVADSLTSTLNVVGQTKPIATNPGPGSGEATYDIAGVAIDPWSGAYAYTSTNATHSKTSLTIKTPDGRTVVADLAKYEKTVNPDKIIQYGIEGTPTACQIKALKAAGAPAKYTGDVDSHPYAVAATGYGSWAVADAGGNDILRVDRWGNVSTIAVLPSQPLKITAAVAAALHVDKCLVGVTYDFEAVPTDVEVGRDGALYVTTLPGGDGLKGSVYRIDPCWGAPTLVATGFDQATNLAIDWWGQIYVAELGSGKIAKVVDGKPVTVLSLPGVVAVEFAHGHLYASTAPAVTGGKGPGTIVELGWE